jgi:hypothetical protein
MKASYKNFINALAVQNGGTTEEVNQVVDWDMVDEIVETKETLEDLKRFRGSPSSHLSGKTEFGDVYVFENVQKAKGLRRGDLYVVEYEDKTLCFFDGEV